MEKDLDLSKMEKELDLSKMEKGLALTIHLELILEVLKVMNLLQVMMIKIIRILVQCCPKVWVLQRRQLVMEKRLVSNLPVHF